MASAEPGRGDAPVLVVVKIPNGFGDLLPVRGIGREPLPERRADVAPVGLEHCFLRQS